MCGIAGFMGQVENRADVIRNMTEVITHRGPDSDGFFTDDNISMGFRRLSIIDLCRRFRCRFCAEPQDLRQQVRCH